MPHGFDHENEDRRIVAAEHAAPAPFGLRGHNVDEVGLAEIACDSSIECEEMKQ